MGTLLSMSGASRFALFLATMALAVAGCGGDDEESSGSSDGGQTSGASEPAPKKQADQPRKKGEAGPGSDGHGGY